MPLEPSRYRVLTFDCYGTLVDWESGILESVRAVLDRSGAAKSDQEILETYARLEAQAESGPYLPYREVLRQVARGMVVEWKLDAGTAGEAFLLEGFHRWEPFEDTVDSLRALHGRYRLAVISNVDDDLFALTARKLKVAFDWVTTAAQARAYKPSEAVFGAALRRMGIQQDRILHVAQSLYHDVAPAAALGLSTVWVRRASRAGSFGVSPPASATPDAQVPDLERLLGLLGLDWPSRPH